MSFHQLYRCCCTPIPIPVTNLTICGKRKVLSDGCGQVCTTGQVYLSGAAGNPICQPLFKVQLLFCWRDRNLDQWKERTIFLGKNKEILDAELWTIWKALEIALKETGNTKDIPGDCFFFVTRKKAL